MDVEVPYLFIRYRPSDIRVRIRPGGQDMHFEDSGANGFELPGAAPSADTAFKDVAYDVTIAATQTFKRSLQCDARSRYGGESRHREQDRGVQGGPCGRTTAHQPPHQVRGAGIRIVRVDGLHSAEASQHVGAAGLAAFGPRPALVARRVQHQTRAVQRDPILEFGFPHPAVGRGTLGV